jgi:aspartyl-tRNA synthetase
LPEYVEHKMLRTHGAGTLRKSDVGSTVALAGWVSRRRDHGGVAFIDLRDATGFVQVVIRDEAVAGALRAEWCIKIVGEVLERPSGNEKLFTRNWRYRSHGR